MTRLCLLLLLALLPLRFALAQECVFDNSGQPDVYYCLDQAQAASECPVHAQLILDSWGGYTGYECRLVGSYIDLYISASDGGWSDTWLQQRYLWGFTRAPSAHPFDTRTSYSYTYTGPLHFWAVNKWQASLHPRPFHATETYVNGERNVWDHPSARIIQGEAIGVTPATGHSHSIAQTAAGSNHHTTFPRPDEILFTTGTYPEWWRHLSYMGAQYATGMPSCPRQWVYAHDPLLPPSGFPAVSGQARWLRVMVIPDSMDEAAMRACADVVLHSIRLDRQQWCTFFTGRTQQWHATTAIRTVRDDWASVPWIRLLCGTAMPSHTVIYQVATADDVLAGRMGTASTPALDRALLCPDATGADPCIASVGILLAPNLVVPGCLATLDGSPRLTTAQCPKTYPRIFWIAHSWPSFLAPDTSITACGTYPPCSLSEPKCQVRYQQQQVRCAALGHGQAVVADCSGPSSCTGDPVGCANANTLHALNCALGPRGFLPVDAVSGFAHSSSAGMHAIRAISDAFVCESVSDSRACRHRQQWQGATAWEQASLTLSAAFDDLGADVSRLRVAVDDANTQRSADAARSLDDSTIPLLASIPGTGWVLSAAAAMDESGWDWNRSCPLGVGPLATQQTVDVFCGGMSLLSAFMVLTTGLFSASTALRWKNGPPA